MLRRMLAALVALGLSVGAAAAQVCGALPNNLQNNTTADATQVMANFNALLGCINNLLTFPLAPQGRLTLTSNTPVMTGDVTAATTIYYTPYVGSFVPIYNGTQFVPTSFAQISATTVAGNQQALQLYDVFVFSNSGAATLGFGPAWSSATSRGSGTGTTQLQQIPGLWTNANIITLLNGTTTYANIAANQATYVGTVYITGTAGQMAMQFHPAPVNGGDNTWLGVWNAYNRVAIRASSFENTTSWTYNTTTWRPANGSSNNRINFVDGLQQSRAVGRIIDMVNTVNSSTCLIGINWDITTGISGIVGQFTNGNGAGTNATIIASDTNQLLGAHFVQALEWGNAGSGNAIFYGNSYLLLQLELEM
jgi:hypothetical protein